MASTGDQRERLREAAAECRACDGVLSAEVLASSTAPQPTWILEIVWKGDVVNAEILERVAANGCAVRTVAHQGRTTVLVAQA